MAKKRHTHARVARKKKAAHRAKVQEVKARKAAAESKPAPPETKSEE